MCGRFALHHTTRETIERFAVEQTTVQLEPRYNIAPSQPVAAIVQHQQRKLEAFQWGLVPFWAKDPKIGHRMINARSETLAEKPAYKPPLKKRRCLIPASGFYEWKRQNDERSPTYICLKDARLFALAGLWEEWRSPAGTTLRSCTIITTPANAFMAGIHQRMPVIFNPEQEEIWLDPALQDPDHLLPLLQAYPAEDMAAHPVSKQVNVPTFDEPACIEAVDEPG